MDELLAEVSSAVGGRKPNSLWAHQERELGEEDLPTLQKPENSGVGAMKIRDLRHSHHQLAMLLAQGQTDVEASLISGYSPAYISGLKADPTFKELLVHYETQRELKFIDVLERMKALGLDSLEEIQQRLADNPGQFSARELMEIAELALVKGRAGPGQGPQGQVQQGGNGAGLNISINFVEKPRLTGPGGPVIDLKPEI